MNNEGRTDMTGRELIIYILENNLEDVSIIDGGKFVGFMTVDEAAEKFEVGIETVKVWVNMGLLKAIPFGGNLYVPANSPDPKLIVREATGGTIWN